MLVDKINELKVVGDVATKILKTNLETIYLEMPRLSHSMVSINQLASLDVVRPIDLMGALNTSRLGTPA